MPSTTLPEIKLEASMVLSEGQTFWRVKATSGADRIVFQDAGVCTDQAFPRVQAALNNALALSLNQLYRG